MERLTTDNPTTNVEAMLNFAYCGEDGRVKLRYADGDENVDLCEYIANNACCQEVDAAAVMDGACMECDCRTSILNIVAIQAAELRARLKRYEDAEEQGQLVVLPCKVGDKVYTAQDFGEEYTPFVDTGIVFAVGIDENGTMWVSVRYESGLKYYHIAEEIGKNVFLTREEAEKALEG